MTLRGQQAAVVQIAADQPRKAGHRPQAPAMVGSIPLGGLPGEALQAKGKDGHENWSDGPFREGLRRDSRRLQEEAHASGSQGAGADESQGAPQVGGGAAAQEGVAKIINAPTLQPRLRVAFAEAQSGTAPPLSRASHEGVGLHSVISAAQQGPLTPAVSKRSSPGAVRVGGTLSLQLAAASSARPEAAQSQEADDAPTPPKAGPLHQESGGLNIQPLSTLRAAHCGRVERKDSNTGERSQRGVSPAALMLVGDQVPPSAPGRGCQGKRSAASGRRSPSCVRRTDGEAPVAQPGSASLPELPGAKVPRSNRGGVSAESTGGRSAERSGERLGSSSPETKGIVAEVKLLDWSVTVALLGERPGFNREGAGSTPASGAGLGLNRASADLLNSCGSGDFFASGSEKELAADGGKTPRSGATGIQHSENDATETRPKLGNRVKAEVVTGGESAAQSGPNSFDTEQGTGTIAPAVSVRREQLANVQLRTITRYPRSASPAERGVGAQGTRVTHLRDHTSVATVLRRADAEKQTVVEAPTPRRQGPSIALNSTTRVSEILSCSFVDPGAIPGGSTPQIGKASTAVRVSEQHTGKAAADTAAFPVVGVRLEAA